MQANLYWSRRLLCGAGVITLYGVVLLMAPWAAAGEIQSVSLAFESQALDLETGAIEEILVPGIIEAGGDVQIAYNALRPTKAVVFPAASSVEMALVEGVAFDGVTAESLSGLVFSPKPADVPFGPDVTVVVRTASGTVFKLGNASENDTGVTFNYAAL